MKKAQLKTHDAAIERAGRRDFLKISLLAGGGATMLTTTAAAATSAKSAIAANKGYRMTAHVRRYYDSARRI